MMTATQSLSAHQAPSFKTAFLGFFGSMTHMLTGMVLISAVGA
jgi:hypothetical protein